MTALVCSSTSLFFFSVFRSCQFAYPDVFVFLVFLAIFSMTRWSLELISFSKWPSGLTLFDGNTPECFPFLAIRLFTFLGIFCDFLRDHVAFWANFSSKITISVGSTLWLYQRAYSFGIIRRKHDLSVFNRFLVSSMRFWVTFCFSVTVPLSANCWWYRCALFMRSNWVIW